jgi:acyl-CoA synthetase (AMP-forming)/AMP-acid ligase II
MRHLLLHQPPADRSRAAVVSEGGAVSWGELLSVTARHKGRLGHLARRRVGVQLKGSGGCYAALAALDALGAAVVLIDAGIGEAKRRDLARELGLSAIVAAVGPGGGEITVDEFHPCGPDAYPGTVTLLTSGTTGGPKAARHTWASLGRPVRQENGAAPTWLLGYRPHLYAGLQVALQCLINGGTLVVPRPGASPQEIARAMAEHGVACSSGTPSYWRRLLLFADAAVLRSAPLRQVTLGGEVVDQQVLDQLSALFPAARIVHVYATTELGRCFSVSDRRSGFPAAFLDGVSPDGVELKVIDGELHVRSMNAMVGYDGGPGTGAPDPSCGRTDLAFAPTGDLVEVQGNRAFFVGRRSDLINVGGNKVHPAQVERVLRAVPGVGDVRVYAMPSSIAGELVACDLVPGPGVDPEGLKREVVRRCASDLPGFQRPRVIRVVNEVAVSTSGKVLRRVRS